MEHLRYPIGRFAFADTYSSAESAEHLANIKVFPELLTTLCSKISEADLKKEYREGGWNVKQLVHHLGESHINAYIRVKLALTEENPTIKPYIESLWINTPENEILDIAVSLSMLKAVQLKLSTLLEHVAESDLNKTYWHPQYNQSFTIRHVMALYSWHGLHHLAHIKLALGIRQ